MKEHKLIPEQELRDFPFLYKFLIVPDDPINDTRVEPLPHITGRIEIIQNDNTRLETFYKCISRF